MARGLLEVCGKEVWIEIGNGRSFLQAWRFGRVGVGTEQEPSPFARFLLKREREALKTQKKGLMQKLLTRQVRVKLPEGGV